VADRTRGYALRFEVSAPAEEIWRGLIEPALIAEWYAPTARISAREGGSYKVKLHNGTEREAHIDIFQPPRRLRLIYMPQSAMQAVDGVIVDDFIIEKMADGCRICLLGSGFPRNFEFAELFQKTQDGWTRALARLKVATEKRVNPGARAAKPAASRGA
jgi:uncharacterized protein YndB with AHSA1/START domain